MRNRVITEQGMGVVLAFVAGAINAGGFLLVGAYTSHLSGILSATADQLALGALALAAAGLAAIACFGLGAATAALLIHWGRRHLRLPAHAPPLLLEAAFLLAFGLLGGLVEAASVLALAVPLLCFLMGLQNATLTVVSGARIRTTHMTGVVTDLGIEIGRLLYWNRRPDLARSPPVRADRAKLRLLSSLLAAFFLGGLLGAVSFSRLGFVSTVPLALALAALAHAVIRAEGRNRRASVPPGGAGKGADVCPPPCE